MVATTRESVPKTTVRAMVIWSLSGNPPEAISKGESLSNIVVRWLLSALHDEGLAMSVVSSMEYFSDETETET